MNKIRKLATAKKNNFLNLKPFLMPTAYFFDIGQIHMTHTHTHAHKIKKNLFVNIKNTDGNKF